MPPYVGTYNLISNHSLNDQPRGNKIIHSLILSLLREIISVAGE